MINFVQFLFKNVYQAIDIETEVIKNAFEVTKKDILYHFPTISENEIYNRIINNSNELAVFLFRLGQHVKNETSKMQIHSLLKQFCNCEIYFNNEIDEGFYVVHGEGTVIGSRNKIGKGFVIHQGCTIGHKKNGTGKGNIIGDNVILYANSSILGELTIGNNVVIGAHILVLNNLEDNSIVTVKNYNN